MEQGEVISKDRDKMEEKHKLLTLLIHSPKK